MKRCWPLVLILISFHAESSDSCDPIRMDAPGGSLEKVKFHNQGDLHICQFNGMAQMIDAARFSSGDTDTTHVTSPLALAIQRFDPITRDKKEYAQQNFFFEQGQNMCLDYFKTHAAKAGSCNEADFMRGLKVKIESDKAKALSRTSNEVRLIRELEKIHHYSEDMEDCESHPEVRVGDNALYLGKFIGDAIKKLGGDTELRQAAFDICKESSKKDFKFLCESEQMKNGPDFMLDQAAATKKLHTFLSENQPQPVSLAICNEALTNKRKNKLKYYSGGTRVGSCSGHTVLVAGRRRADNGQCQLLLRNSQDVDCSDYAFPENCEADGQYWIDEDHLTGNIKDISRLVNVN